MAKNKRERLKRFVASKKVEDSLASIASIKKELRRLKREELQKISKREKQEIKLAITKAKADRKKVEERYEEKTHELGKIHFWREKRLELQKRVDTERGELQKTNKKHQRPEQSNQKTSKKR